MCVALPKLIPTARHLTIENVFVLIPVAPGLDDSPETRKHYYDLVMKRLERLTGQSVRDAVVYQRSYAPPRFCG